MIDADGKRVAKSQDDSIPPHMLVGRPSSSVQAQTDAGELGQSANAHPAPAASAALSSAVGEQDTKEAPAERRRRS